MAGAERLARFVQSGLFDDVVLVQLKNLVVVAKVAHRVERRVRFCIGVEELLRWTLEQWNNEFELGQLDSMK